jgi:hypothetical protein
MSNIKDKEFRKLSIDSFFNFEADHIEIAHKQVKLIHNTGDISAAGDQFEIAIRDFFKIKLPEKYYISNGHIIDINLNTTPQLDLIIADNFRTPILYKTLNNTEYLTFESVYSYAEIKSSWEKKHLEDFIITRTRIDTFLSRQTISPKYIDTGGKGIELDTPTTRNPYKNPILSFMFVGNSANFSFEHITTQFKETDWKFLPNIICLFDKGIIVNINKLELDRNVFKINLYPEFVNTKREDNEWVLLTYDQKRSTLGTLYYIILEHLNTCVLGYPNMLDYMQQIFEINPNNINFVTDYDQS